MPSDESLFLGPVTPLGGLLWLFAWAIDKIQPNRAHRQHPIEFLKETQAVHSSHRINFRGARVVVACDVVQAGLGDRALLLQLAWAAYFAGATTIELQHTVPPKDPAYRTKPQETMRFLLENLAPPDTTVLSGWGKLRLHQADVLLWAANIPDRLLPLDVEARGSFGDVAKDLGLPLGEIDRSIALEQDRNDALKPPILLLQQAAGTNADFLQSSAYYAIKAAQDRNYELHTFGLTTPAEQPSWMQAALRQVTTVDHGLCPLPELLGLMQRARMGVGPNSGPLHLAALAGCPWLVPYSNDPRQKLTDWWFRHYSQRIQKVSVGGLL